eukprot:1148024-Pelagomonas_calceolata.AAC.1
MASNKNALNDSPSLTACQFPAFLSQNEANPTGCLFPARRVAARDSIQLSTDPNDVELWIYNSPWTLPWLKKNEVAIRVVDVMGAAGVVYISCRYISCRYLKIKIGHSRTYASCMPSPDNGIVCQQVVLSHEGSLRLFFIWRVFNQKCLKYVLLRDPGKERESSSAVANTHSLCQLRKGEERDLQERSQWSKRMTARLKRKGV